MGLGYYLLGAGSVILPYACVNILRYYEVRKILVKNQYKHKDKQKALDSSFNGKTILTGNPFNVPGDDPVRKLTALGIYVAKKEFENGGLDWLVDEYAGKQKKKQPIKDWRG